MRLKNYGPGEAMDRLSILSLKMLFGGEAHKDISHFRTEQVLLLTEIRAQNHLSTWIEEAVELTVVNAALWHAEDDMRAHRDSPTHAATLIAALAFRIQGLNDVRAALIGRINKATGNHLGEEKSHVEDS